MPVQLELPKAGSSGLRVCWAPGGWEDGGGRGQYRAGWSPPPTLHSNESAALCWVAGLPRGRVAQVGFLGPKCQESRLRFNGSRRKNSHPFQRGTTRDLSPGALQWSLAPRPQAESLFSERELRLPLWLLSSSQPHHRREAAQKHIGCR